MSRVCTFHRAIVSPPVALVNSLRTISNTSPEGIRQVLHGAPILIIMRLDLTWCHQSAGPCTIINKISLLSFCLYRPCDTKKKCGLYLNLYMYKKKIYIYQKELYIKTKSTVICIKARYISFYISHKVFVFFLLKVKQKSYCKLLQGFLLLGTCIFISCFILSHTHERLCVFFYYYIRYNISHKYIQ